jgi:hypothetical protein
VLVTPEHRYEYTFHPGINAVTGEIGSGKSTLLELAKYGLGGDADLRPAVLKGVHRVVVDITIGQTRQQFARDIRGTSVEVLEADGVVSETLSVSRTKQRTRAADYLLELIDWPQLRIASKRTPGRSQPISFFDLYSYCYVSQAEIDRSVVHHLESVRQPKRKATFELLLGLTNEEVERARVDIGEIEHELDEKRRHLATIDSFLAHGDTPSEEQLVARRSEATGRISEAERRLTEAQAVVDSATTSMERIRADIAEAAAALRDSETRLQELDAELGERRRLADEIRVGLVRVERASAAAGVLAAISYRQCPRCMQSIDPERFDRQVCYVCGQSEAEDRAEELDDPDGALQREQQRLRALGEEIRTLDDETRVERTAMEASRRQMVRRIDLAEGELEDQSRQQLGPVVETLRAASADRAAADEAVRQIDVQLMTWAERARLLAPIRELERRLADRKADLVRELDAAAARRSRITELSDLFDEIIQALGMPWYETGAHINPTSYLPVVNGVDIKDLGSGGMKMMTNVAYHLALLTYGLSNRIDTIPDLLIIDSPRKNLGSSVEDQAHAEAFYRWVAALTRTYEDQFQLIIADNDEPPPGTPLRTHVRLSHLQPLIRDLPHPGDEVDTIGST